VRRLWPLVAVGAALLAAAAWIVFLGYVMPTIQDRYWAVIIETTKRSNTYDIEEAYPGGPPSPDNRRPDKRAHKLRQQPVEDPGIVDCPGCFFVAVSALLSCQRPKSALAIPYQRRGFHVPLL
jgi:hypothetical protein